MSMAVFALSLAVLAGPAVASPNKTHLSNATVSPRTGNASTVFTFSVVYTSDTGRKADLVKVVVRGSSHAMSATSATWRKGVTFRWSGPLPVGTHAVSFSARASDGSQANLAAGTVTITPRSAPKPKPTPTPEPVATPRATREPTPRATARPRPTATSSEDPGAVGGWLGGPGGPNSNGPRDGWPAWYPEPTLDGLAGIVILTPTATQRPAVVGAIGYGKDGRGGPVGGGDPGGGPLATVLAMVGIHGPPFPVGLAPTLVTVTGATAMAMAFGLFGRKRRDGDPPDDDVLAAAAAAGMGRAAVVMTGELGDDDLETIDQESLMPRWRRPSLLQARKADPIRDNTPAPRLTFDKALTGPLDGRERRVIRYRVVRLLDAPDELRGTEIGYLDQGDEVQLIEKQGAYWLIVSPDGQQGWLHKMVLGDAVEERPASDGPTATMPIAAETWTMGETDADSGLLEAYLAARRREA
jgi:hypothetical protein